MIESSKKFELLSGWALAKKAKVRTFRPSNIEELKSFIAKSPKSSIIARGLGRSYGDASIINNGTVIILDAFNKLEINTTNRTITVGAGLSFAEILKKIIPMGLFLPVIPGTSNITIGGAIASDVHGKNHHIDGSFGNYVKKINLVDGKGREQELYNDHVEKSDKFWATVGGMGLTGVIFEATIELIAISTSFMKVDTKRFSNLDLLMKEMENSDSKYKYSVAWVDCLNDKFRGVLTSANHAKIEDLHKNNKDAPLNYSSNPIGNAPNILNIGLINKFTIRAFNSAWFLKSPENLENEIQSISSYFQPLDGIKNWNRLYGSKGFLQYQFVVPPEYKNKIKEVLEVLQSINAASFLTVLKRFGKANKAPLSFPTEGWTLAIDIPNSTPKLFETLIYLDKLILKSKGKIYLAKDCRQLPIMFKNSYVLFDKWLEIKKELDPDCKFVSDISNRLEFFNCF